MPYFGFKAKHNSTNYPPDDNCTVPYFGFKAKRRSVLLLWFSIVLCLILDSRQNTARTVQSAMTIVLCLILDSRQNLPEDRVLRLTHCTVPYFGFKAKRKLAHRDIKPDCTVPYFGFKAKLSLRL